MYSNFYHTICGCRWRGPNWLWLLAIIFSAGSAFGQGLTSHSIGNGTNGNIFTVFNNGNSSANTYNGSISLFAKDELDAVAFPVNGVIKKLRYQRATSGTAVYSDTIEAKVYFKNLADTSSVLGPMTWGTAIAGATATSDLILDYKTTPLSSGSYAEIDVSSANFTYTGGALLIIIQARRKANATANTATWATSTVNNRTRYINSSAPLLPTAPTTSAARANIRITAERVGAAPIAKDIQVTQVVAPTSASVGSVAVQATVFNNSTTEINDATFTVSVNGVPQTVNYNGAIDAFASATISLGNVTVASGNNSVVVEAATVNGFPDEGTVNNLASAFIFAGTLNGTYTIDPSEVYPSNRTFNSLRSFGTALSAAGVSAAVTANVVAGSDTIDDQLDISAFTGASASNRVFINGNQRRFKCSTIDFNNRAFATLGGCTYVTVANFNFSQYGNSEGIFANILPQSKNCRVVNNTVRFNVNASGSTLIGVTISGTRAGNLNTGLAGVDSISIVGNTIKGGNQGIYLRGLTAATNVQNILVANNDVSDFYSAGIEIAITNNVAITGNNVYNLDRTVFNSTSLPGIYLNGACTNTTVSNNRIHDLMTTNSSTVAIYGIYVPAAAVGPNNFFNNLIYSLNNSGTCYGVFNQSTGSNRYYHNTIYINNPLSSAGSTVQTAGIAVTNTTGTVVVQSNLIYVARAYGTYGTGRVVALQYPTASVVTTSNHNGLWVETGTSRPNAYLGRRGTTDYANRAAWSVVANNNYDANSVEANPNFGTANYGLTPTTGILNDIGPGTLASVTGLNKDYLNQNRPLGTAPDPGAIEFTANTLPDPEPLSISVTNNSFGDQDVKVVVRNNGVSTITTLRIFLTIEGQLISSTVYNTNIASNATQEISLGTQTINSISPNITVDVASPNGGTDANLDNNLLVSKVRFCGVVPANTYTIDPTKASQPAVNQNFKDFEDLAYALRTCGITGSITVNVLSSGQTYTGPFELNQVAGSGSGATITINGNGETLEAFINSASSPAVMLLNGTDYLTVNNLKLKVSSTSTRGFGMQLTGNATYNTFNQVQISNDLTNGLTSTYAGVVLSSTVGNTSGSGANGNNNTWSNCTIDGGYYGFMLYGDATTVNNKVLNTSISNFFANGMIADNQHFAVFSGNTISRPTRTVITSIDAYGFSIQNGGQGIEISNNTFTNMQGGNTGSTFAIRIGSLGAATGTPVRVFNNLIYNLSNTGIRKGITVEGASSSNIQIMHNTVALSGTGGTGLAYGISVEAAASNISIYNNLIYNTRSTSGAKALIALTNTGAGVVSNNNAFFTDEPAKAFVFGTSSYTFDGWKAINSDYDANSRFADPGFSDLTTAAGMRPNAVQINNMGRETSLTGITTDFEGTTRASRPDPGVYEFTVNGPDLVLEAMVNPVVGGGTGNRTVTLRVFNNGNQAVTTASIATTINGNPFSTVGLGGSLAAGASRIITLGTFNFPAGNTTLRFSATNINGGADINPENDTLRTTIFLCSPLTGTVTVQSGVTQTGTEFPSFAVLANVLNSCGVNGNLTVNVVAGTYANDKLYLTNVPGSGFITINGNNSTLTFAGSAIDRNIVSLTGVTGLAVNNLTLTNNGSAGNGIYITNNVKNVTFNNCNVNGPTNSTDATLYLASVVIGSADNAVSSAATGVSDITFNACDLNGFNTAVLVNGDATNMVTGLTVKNSTLRNFYAYGFRLANLKDGLVQDNLITRPSRTSYGASYVFYLRNNIPGLVVERNRITGMSAGALTSSSLFHLINIDADASASSPAIFRNNLFYNNQQNGIQHAINVNGGSNLYFDNNTFSQNQGGGSGQSYFYYSNAVASTNVRLRNNIYMLSSASSSSARALYYLANTTPAVGAPAESNGNIFWAIGTTSLGIYSKATTVQSATLADWQNDFGLDKNSRFGIDPNVASLTDPTQLFPREKAVDNIGVATTATTDYAGTARGANIDAGAYQFTGTTGGVANDDCAAAQALTSGGACSNTGFSTALASRSGSTCSGTSRPADDDVWFSFTPSSSNVAVLVTGGTAAGTLRNPVIELYSGSCGSMSIMACQNAETGATESVRSNVTPGQTYYVRVYSAGEEQINAGTGTICVLEEAVITTSVTGGTTYHSVTVKNGGNLTLPASASVYYDLTVESGGTLTLTGATTVVSGNRLIVKDGATLNIAHPQGISTTANTGALRFSSITMGRVEANHTATGNSVTGNAWPTNVTNMSIAPGTGNTVTLTAPVNVFGTLTVTNGTLAAGTNALVLKSAAAGTAAVAPLTGGAAITGSNITAERWIPFYGYPTGMYVMVGTPITGKTAAAWANNGNTLTYGTTSSSVWDYDPTNSQYQGWVPQANGSMAAAPGKGLYVFFRNGLQQQTSKITGSLFQGNTTQNLKYCASGCSYGSENGFNLIANPYAAPIDFDRVTRNNTDAAVYIFNHQRQAYVTYVNGISTVPGDALFSNGILASGQGFMVRANAADASVTFSESNKEVGVNPNVYRQQPAGTLRLKLAGADQEDVAVVAFRANATLGHDANFDAAKFPNAGLNLASFGTAAHGMAINSIPAQISSRTELPLSVSAATSGSLTISLEEAANLPEMDVWLLDRQSGMQYPVTAGFSYSFVHNTASNGNNNRLFLVFEPAAATAANAQLNGKALLEVYPNPSTDGAVTVAAQNLKGDKHVLTVTDVVGRVMSTQAISATGSLNIKLAQQLPAGVYQIQLETNGERLNSRLVVK